jgi:hypothetical protein
MKNEMNRSNSPTRLVMSEVVLASLPRLEQLPENQRRDLIQALAALLLHDPDLQALLEVRHEPVG